MFLDTLGWRDLPATPSNIWWHTHEHPAHFSISPKHLFPWFHQFMALVNWWTVVSILQTWFLATAFWCMGIGASSTCREVEIGWIKYRLRPTDGKETCCCCGSVWHCAYVDMMQHKSMVTSFLVALAPGLESTRPIQWGHSAQMFSLPHTPPRKKPPSDFQHSTISGVLQGESLQETPILLLVAWSQGWIGIPKSLILNQS